MPIDSKKIYFPEFENYQIFEGKTKLENTEKGFVEAFRYVGNGLWSMASFFGDKYQQYDIGSKIKNGGTATLKGLSFVGHYLYELSKPTIKYASDKAVEGVGYLYKQISGNNKNEDNKDNLLNKKKDEEKDGCLIIRMDDESSFQNDDNQNNNQDHQIIKENEEENNEINNNEKNNQDYPTLSKVNKDNEGENNEINNNENKNSAEPIYLIKADNCSDA